MTWTTPNREGRRHAPEQLQLNPIGEEQFLAYQHIVGTGLQVGGSALYQQFPEAWQRQADQQATDALRNMAQSATQGAVVQSPGTWSPQQEMRVGAPQGPFDEKFIRNEMSEPADGFRDLYEKSQTSHPMTGKRITDEATAGIAALEQYLTDQAQSRSLDVS